MIKPPKLKKGDIVGLISPSNPLREDNKAQVEDFKEYLSTVGLKVKFSKSFSFVDKYGVSAGSGKERADEINSMFQDEEVDAIWCLQGGDTAIETLDLIDYELIKQKPKIFVGKSDVDVLSLAINKMTGLIAFHGPDSKIGSGHDEMDPEYSKRWFVKRLFEGAREIERSSNWVTIREGAAEGLLLGCNLTSILKLAGTRFFPDFSDSILFLETYASDVRTSIYQLKQLSLIGVFNQVKGIVIGSNYEFDGGHDAHTFEQIVNDATSDCPLPILKTNEFGHYQPHAFLPIGAKISLDATNRKMELIQDFLN